MLAEADLPDDPEVLRAMIVAANARTAELTAEFERISAEAERNAVAKAEADAEIARLSSIIAAFARHRFGPRSEKLDDDQFDLVMEDRSIAIAKVEAKLDAVGTPAKRAEKQRRANRGSLPAHLERIEQLIDVDSKHCACCGGDLHAIGEDVAERLDVVPASFRALVTRRPRYACRACEGEVVQAPAPPRIVEGGLPTDALVAQVLVSKYADHLPLYRQAQIYARQGVNLDRSTLADWVGRAAWYLAPLRDHLLAELKRGPRLFADETTAPVLDPGQRRTKTGQIWAYARDDRPWGGADPPAVAFIYGPLARQSGPRRVSPARWHPASGRLCRLPGDRPPHDVALAFCWVHLHRKFFGLAKADASPTAAEALQMIEALSAIEDEIRGWDAENRRAVRRPAAERSKSRLSDIEDRSIQLRRPTLRPIRYQTPAAFAVTPNGTDRSAPRFANSATRPVALPTPQGVSLPQI